MVETTHYAAFIAVAGRSRLLTKGGRAATAVNCPVNRPIAAGFRPSRIPRAWVVFVPFLFFRRNVDPKKYAPARAVRLRAAVGRASSVVGPCRRKSGSHFSRGIPLRGMSGDQRLEASQWRERSTSGKVESGGVDEDGANDRNELNRVKFSTVFWDNV